MAVELIKHAIVSVHDTKSEPMLTAMETDTDQARSNNTNNTNDPTQPTQTQLNLPAIINKLKKDIATITQATQAFATQQLPPKLQNNTTSSSAK